MQLYVVRHAIAEDRDPEKWPDDSNRPLTKQGVKRFRRAAAGLRRVAPQADIVLSSPYVRAWDTALILEEEAGWPSPVACPELTVDAPEALLDVIKTFGHADSIAIVGHEPYLSRFTSRLLSPGWGPWLEFKKGGIAQLARMEGSGPDRFQLRWLLTPGTLRRLAKR